MTSIDYLARAAECCEQGNEADDNCEYWEAIDYFQQAFDFYELAMARENDESQRILLAIQEAIVTKIKRLRRFTNLQSTVPVTLDERTIDSSSTSSQHAVAPTKPKSKAIAEQSPCDSQEESIHHEQMRQIVSTAEQLSTGKRWIDVIGLGSLKEKLLLRTKLRRSLAHLYENHDDEASGILLYGPPGTGKTFIVKALASECKMAFLAPSIADLVTRYVGDASRYIKAMFDVAREVRPCVLFLDEIDGLCVSRETHQSEESKRAINVLLQQMQGFGDSMRDILVVGATNRPLQLDTALLSRMPDRFLVSLPTETERLLQLQHLANSSAYCTGYEPESGKSRLLTAQNIESLAQCTDNYSGRDLSALFRAAYDCTIQRLASATHFRHCGQFIVQCRPDDAGAIAYCLETVSEGISQQFRPYPITHLDLLWALGQIKPLMTSEEQLRQYDEFTAQYGKSASV